jgi:hypothetical protein
LVEREREREREMEREREREENGGRGVDAVEMGVESAGGR